MAWYTDRALSHFFCPSSTISSNNQDHSETAPVPTTLPLTTAQYEKLVELGTFEGATGQVELINGRIVRMPPQEPEHSDPIDYLSEWSVLQSKGQFTIRVEKPIRIPDHHSCPEPDLAWVARRRYFDQHPNPLDVCLLIEVSFSSSQFDRAEKQTLYARSGIVEYWQVDVPSRTVSVHRSPKDGEYATVQILDTSMTISPQCSPESVLPIKELFANQ